MKKLKGLGNRAYNVMFHTHTVAGIVISFALFVIFYAGAFSLFRHDVAQWENPDRRQPLMEELDYDKVLAKVDSAYELNFHETTNFVFPSEEDPLFYVYGAYSDTDTTTKRMRAYVSPQDLHIQDIDDPKTTASLTIYYLHYFRQIPVIGLFLSGFVGLFFLFAVVTGVLVHWRNLLTKFYAFVREGKWKNIWTNAHTVLGVIGLPFQVMYAITGTFFGLLTFILLPAVFLLYDGDQSKLVAKVFPLQALEVAEDAPPADNMSLNDLASQVEEMYPNHYIRSVQLRNYGMEGALATWNIDDGIGMHASGSIVTEMKDGSIMEEYSVIPDAKPYSGNVIDYIFKLHFGSFGGRPLKVIYFILSMITCFMIISGVLIWRTARDNNLYTYKQKLFHHRVTKWYLAICLSMFPAFAIIFLANKIVPMEMVSRTVLVNRIFFLSWLGLTILGVFWNKYSQQNRNYLIIGGFLSLIIPIANGVTTGGWVWNVWDTYPSVAYVDLFWFFAGLTALYLSFFVLKVKHETDTPQPKEQKVKKPKQEKVVTPSPLKELVLKFKSLRSTSA